MKFESLTPNMMVKSVNETIGFYHQHFGFVKITCVPEEGELNWALIQKDEVQLMLQSVESLHEDIPALQSKMPGGGLTFYLKMNGVEDLYHQVKGDVKVADDIRTTFYGAREFTIEDPDGYFITFAQQLE